MQLDKEYVVYGFIKKILFCSVLWCFSSTLYAATVQLNTNGGSNASDGLRTYVEDTTQIQVRRLNSTGQLYSPTATPTNTLLDNGIYLRANGALIGPDHFGFPNTLTPTAYINRTLTTPAPAAVSQGVTQSTTAQFSAPRFSTLIAGPSVTVNWKYTYPLDYITAEVTLVIPLGYPISSSNPVRYYHAVDTYLGGDDRGCGVRYVDTNGKQIVGTYPLSGNTNTPCPSSNSLPANLDVVESFRERTRSFDHYCVGEWNSFWTNNTNNACAIAKTGSLSDTLSTIKIDTGIAIEYDFVLPGTYTFSYDFVVGSTFVPNYDHLEIRHPGNATLCPVDIQVLACLTNTVPCPSNQLVTTGLLEGDLTVSPSTPTVTATPNSGFKLGGDGSIDTVTITGSAAATYTLGAANLTKAPLSGVKCWNTATNSQSCNITFSSTPCLSTFECMENGLTYNANTRNSIYTKLTGRAFDLDVYALTNTGARTTGYVSATDSVTVELVTEVGGTCGNSILPVAKKTVTFTASDAGKKTISFSASDVPNAYQVLRCRVVDGNLNKSGCSSDNFAVRPQAFTLSSLNATASTPAGPSSVPFLKAGTNFQLQALSGESNYIGTPKIASIAAHTGAPAVGILSYEGSSGTVYDSLPTAVAGKSVATNFKYSEVGLFQFLLNSVYDDSFAEVDRIRGDCSSASATEFDNAGSGTPKMYGCKIGSVTSSYFGRFIPDHFKESSGTPDNFACTTFAYYGQFTPTMASFNVPFIITAENVANVKTQNYTGDYGINSYAKLDLSKFTSYNFSSDAPVGAALSASPLTPTFANTTAINTAATFDKGEAKVKAKLQLSRPPGNSAPQNVLVSARPVDDDGVTSASTQITSTGIPFKYGRLAIAPAHGSELLPLTMPVEAQFWNGSNAFVRSTTDACTTIPIQSFVMKNYRGNLNACETQLSVASAMASGVLRMRLSAPGVSGTTPNTGSVDLEVNLAAKDAPPLPPEKVCTGSAESNSIDGALPWFGTSDPSGRASFGIYKAPIIYMRENFGP
jgi:MSHA biogenesis protein MshQ